jgi:hypothetical protein
MGGINRCAPAQDVSYEHMLDEEPVNELSVGKMQAYKDAAQSNQTLRSRPIGKIAKSVRSVSSANQKIDTKTGNRRQGPVPDRGTYESRLAEFLEMDEDFDKILNKQHADNQAAARKPVVDIDFYGWTIRYRPISSVDKVAEWQVMDKKGAVQHKGSAATDQNAVRDAQEWIKAGGGTRQEASNNVTIDFNVDFSREFADHGETFYVSFDKDNNTSILILSLVPQPGFKRSHVRTQKEKTTASTIPLQMVSLTPKESNAAGLQPNGRYILGDKDPIDDNTAMFPLIPHPQGIVQSKGDRVLMGKPGLTVAHNRGVDEEYYTVGWILCR